MAEQEVPMSQENATLLLAAAEELELDPSVVRVSDGVFLAPEEVVGRAFPPTRRTPAKKTKE